MLTKEKITKILRENYPYLSSEYGVRRIGFFGSFAKDMPTESSDVDIVVNLRKPDFLALIGIKQALEEQLHHPVDIVRYRDNMNKYLKQRIDNEAIYV